MPWLVALVLGLALLTSGCAVENPLGFSLVDPQVSQVHNEGAIVVLQDPARVLTQSFTMKNSGLNRLTLWVSQPEGSSEEGYLNLSLFAGGNAVPFYSRNFTAQAIQQNTPLYLTFEPRSDPPGETYTLILSAEGGAFEIHGRNEDIYGEGMATLDGLPLNADLAFETSYAYTFTAMEQDLSRLGDWAKMALPLFAVLILPGWMVLELAGLRKKFDFWENLALSTGFSLALLPLLMLWTTLFNLPWTTNGLWVLVILGAGALIGALVWRRAELKPTLPSPTSLAMLLVFLLACGVRVVMVRDMAAPAWVDSVHHALLGKLIAEAGAYPASFAPYLELEPTHYHPGFHVSLAAVLLLGKADPAQALLVLGQVLNMLAVVAVYLFTTTLTQDKRAGVAAALAAGLFSPMPAYYTSWGRDTMLAGMVILPVPVALWRGWIEREAKQRSDWVYPALTSLAMGGLFLVHYIVAAFAGLILLLDWLASLFRHGKVALRFAFFAGGLALLLTFPWLLPMLTRTMSPALAASVPTAAKLMENFPWGNLTANHGKYLLWMAGAAIPVALWQRQRIALLVPAWVGLVLALSNLSALGLPIAPLVNHTIVAIFLYLPITLLAGYLVSEGIRFLAHVLPERFHLAGGALLVLAVLVLGVVGGRKIVTVLNPNLYLVRTADLTGIAWAKENLPPGETVLVNPFLWGYGTYAGGDGGYWLSALAGLPTLPPPVIQSMQRSPEAGALNTVSAEVLQQAQHPEALVALMQRQSIEYLFLGARGGPLSPSLLLQSGLFEMLYANQGVYIFGIREDSGPIE